MGHTVYMISILGFNYEAASWNTYIAPFDQKLWLCLILSSVLVSIVIWLLHQFPKGQNDLKVDEAIWIATSALFGINIIKDANDTKTNGGGRMMLFIVFICGSGFFYGYEAYLTSALAVPNEFLPFNTPNELLLTDYRLVVPEKKTDF